MIRLGYNGENATAYTILSERGSGAAETTLTVGNNDGYLTISGYKLYRLFCNK